MVLEDGGGAATAHVSNATTAALLDAPTPAALLALLAVPDEASRAAVKARLDGMKTRLVGSLGAIDVELPAPGALPVVTRIGAPAGDAETQAAGWALLQRLRRNGQQQSQAAN